MSRFTTLTATYRIVTPMFCGGAGQEAELRLSSFKGALRFWWRSLQWGKVRDEKELWAKEAELFGSSDQSFGQSKVRMRFDGSPQLEQNRSIGQIFEEGKLLGAHYLGYGVMEAFDSPKAKKKAGQLTREMIPGGTFKLSLRCGPNLGADELKEIRNSLILLGTVGGLGSKSRKGYGSLSLTELNCDGSPLNLDKNLEERLKGILSSLQSEAEPTWTAWCSKSRIVIAHGNAQPTSLLNQLGSELVRHRSWGKDGKVLNAEPSEFNFRFDHDLHKQPNENSHPKRLAFGLPHNYGKGDSNSVQPKDLDRRASPLFFHIHQDDASRPIAVLAFLPSLFLPNDEKLKSFGNEVALDRTDGFWDPIHGYLDRLLEKPRATTKKDSTLKAQEVSLV